MNLCNFSELLLNQCVFTVVLIINIDCCKVSEFTSMSIDGEDILKNASLCCLQVQNICIHFKTQHYKPGGESVITKKSSSLLQNTMQQLRQQSDVIKIVSIVLLVPGRG